MNTYKILLNKNFLSYVGCDISMTDLEEEIFVEANSLNHLFWLCNQEDEYPLLRRWLSVGDVVLTHLDGDEQYYVVDNQGFTPLIRFGYSLCKDDKKEKQLEIQSMFHIMYDGLSITIVRTEDLNVYERSFVTLSKKEFYDYTSALEFLFFSRRTKTLPNYVVSAINSFLESEEVMEFKKGHCTNILD